VGPEEEEAEMRETDYLQQILGEKNRGQKRADTNKKKRAKKKRENNSRKLEIKMHRNRQTHLRKKKKGQNRRGPVTGFARWKKTRPTGFAGGLW